MHGMTALRQPFTKQLLIQMIEDQPFGPTSGSGHHANVLRGQSMRSDVLTCTGTNVDVQSFHGR